MGYVSMKIQSISNISFQKINLKPVKTGEKINKSLDPVQQMNRDFTKAAIIILMIELGMVTAAYFKNKAKKELNPQQDKQEVVAKPDVLTSNQINLVNF